MYLSTKVSSLSWGCFFLFYLMPWLDASCLALSSTEKALAGKAKKIGKVDVSVMWYKNFMHWSQYCSTSVKLLVIYSQTGKPTSRQQLMASLCCFALLPERTGTRLCMTVWLHLHFVLKGVITGKLTVVTLLAPSSSSALSMLSSHTLCWIYWLVGTNLLICHLTWVWQYLWMNIFYYMCYLKAATLVCVCNTTCSMLPLL